MEQSKNENADDMKPITDVTKEEEQERKRDIFRCKAVLCCTLCRDEVKRVKQRKSENADDTKQITDGASKRSNPLKTGF
ncbi:hypothetical protein T4C_9884 [Trichinella pseudospiralis]|uniref:Uncharacterized protein n=1 Tax=Trichinella pseudospiralis TaxID=6337 RepID=A0A0V1JV05_TRIPS|nr:hypothetical protein T4C_9884 [Trichinella pseudospiralis]